LKLPNLKNAKRLCIDTETYDPNLFATGPSVRTGGYIAGFSVATDDAAWYIPINHAQGENVDPAKALKWADDMFSGDCDKVFTNAIYDLDFLAEAGVTVGGRILDIQVAEPLIDEQARSYSLDTLAKKYLGDSKVDDDLYEYCAIHFGGTPTRKQAGNIWRCPPEIVGPYAIGDVTLPLRIIDLQMPILEELGLMDVFKMESELIPMLLAMKRRGVRVDVEAAHKYHKALESQVPSKQKKLDELAGFEVNPNATSDIAKIFDQFGIPYDETEKGNPSFTSAFMSTIDHEAAGLITEIKHLTKFKDTYLSGYVFDYEINGRIHCQFNALRSDDYGTTTGRFSCSDPNLQNIPIDKNMRALYKPDEGHDWWKLDYSQIEYRLAVHYGKGQSADLARSLYNEDPTIDFHQMIADMVNVDRRKAKGINFGMLYGMGVKKLALQLNVPMGEAKKLSAQYHANAPFVKDLLSRADRAAVQRGFIRTIMGRRRNFNLWEPDRWTKGKFPKPYEQAKEEYGSIKRAYTYRALNSIVQGGAADIMKKAMVDVWHSGVCDVLGAPLLTVHDELDWSVPRGGEGLEAMKEVKRLMETCVDLTVPYITDVEKGDNWGNIKDVKL
tara:strand:- start:2941 stop:4776 length:1836 start_codon:yes stop_codon:yes gene_type:complete